MRPLHSCANTSPLRRLSDLTLRAALVTTFADDVLDHAPCGFLSFADDGTITLVNATLLTLLGYTRDELVGQPVETIFTLGSRIFYQTHVFPLVKIQGSAQELFLLLRTKEGNDVGVLANVAQRERNGTTVHDCVVMHVVERRRYEDALLQAKRDAELARAESEARQQELMRVNETLEFQRQRMEEQATELEATFDELRMTHETLLERSDELERERARADEANRAKSAFLANMSHELRTPLNAIGGYTQLLELGIHGTLSDEQLDVLGRVQRGQRHLLGLINDVLNLSRIEAGHVEYRIETVSLREVVHEVMPMIEPQLGAKGVSYAVNVDEELCARGDRDKLQQILINLLSNAIKFTPRGGHVAVDTGRRELSEDWVFLRITDTGVGIPRDRLENVFEPFVQVGGETRPSEGTGLGLAISRDLARGMGGDLRARSAAGAGSVFTLSLPAAERGKGDEDRESAEQGAL